MNRTTSTLLLAATLCGGLSAQTAGTAPVAQPTSPAPAVSAAPATGVPAPAPVVVQAPAASTATAPANVTQVVYTPQLPNVADVTNAAAAQGYTVERVVQTATQVIAFYRNANGQPVTVAYQSLPPSGTAPAPAPVVVTAPPPTTVVYESAPRVVYYDPYPAYYYPRVWYPPVSFSFGFGYHSFHGGHSHGFRHR